MKKIYKYMLGVDGDVVTITGKFSNLLTIQSQNGWPHIWIELDDNYPEVSLEIAAIGTGWELPQHNMIYAGTAQDAAGFVWHYYYRSKGVNNGNSN